MGTLHDYTSCWTTLGPFQSATGAPQRPKTAPKMSLFDPQMALTHFPWEYYMILCHAGPPWGLFRGLPGPKMAQNSTKMALYGPKWPFMTLNDASMKSLHDP